MSNFNTNSTAQKVLDKLAAYNLKSKGNGEYRCNSPFRAGSDSHGFVVTINSDEYGVYFDHASNETGTLYALAERLGIERPNRAPVANSKREYSGLKDYAESHGISEKALRAWGWTETVYNKRRALSFTTSGGTRYRFVDGDSSKPTYISQKGYQACWYGFADTLFRLLRDGAPLVLCNGEISTIAGQEYGLAAVCVTSGEKASISDGLLHELKAVFLDMGIKPNIVIAMDCDKTGRHAARGLQAQLTREGFNARAVDLRLGDKGDLADFVTLYGADASERLMQCPALEPDPAITIDAPFRILGRDEMYHLPPVEWVIPNRVPKEGLVAIYGKSGTYKSFYSLELALSLATHSPVAYIAAEGFSGYRFRLEAWEKHHGEQASHIGFVKGDVDLYDETALAILIESLKAGHYALVVIDTLAMVSGMADENSARDMNRIIKGFKRIIQECQTTVMIVHHTNKVGEYERGSSALRGAMDVMIKLTPHETEKDVVMVTCEKMKDAPKFEPFSLKVKPIDLGYNTSLGEPAVGVVMELLDGEPVLSSGLNAGQMSLLRVVNEMMHNGDKNRKQVDIARKMGKSKGAVSKYMSKLIEGGFVTLDGATVTLTAKGKTFVMR